MGGRVAEKDKTRANSTYEAMVKERAVPWSSTSSYKEKREIAEKLFNDAEQLGLRFVYQKDGTVTKVLSNDHVLKLCKRHLQKEGKILLKEQPRLAVQARSEERARPPEDPPVGNLDAVAISTLVTTSDNGAIVDSAPSDTGTIWNETMQQISNKHGNDNVGAIRNQTFVKGTNNNIQGDYKPVHNHYHTNSNPDNSFTMGEIKKQLGSIENKIDLTNNKVDGLTPHKPRINHDHGSLSSFTQPNFDSPLAFEKPSLGVNALAYCEDLLSTQDNIVLQKEVDKNMEALKNIQIVKTTENLPTTHFDSEHPATRYLILQRADPNTLCIIENNDKVPVGCIFYDNNTFAKEKIEETQDDITTLVSALGFTHVTYLKVDGEGEEDEEEDSEGEEDEKEDSEALIVMATKPKSTACLSKITAFVCHIVIHSSSLIDSVVFEGSSNVTKYQLSLDADVLETFLQSFSHVEFDSLRLLDTHLGVMGHATGGVKTFKFVQCEFSLEGTNRLFHRNEGSVMELEVSYEIPNSSFFADCEKAIKTGFLKSLLINHGLKPIRLPASDFWIAVNIQRALLDKGEKLFFSKDTEVDRPFNVGKVYTVLNDKTLSATQTAEAIDKVAKMNPDGYKNEREYKNQAISEVLRNLKPS